MATRETQTRILEAAISLFNEASASSVSSNRIAEAAGISKGNLHYHYASKEEIIFDIWNQMEVEIRNWADDATRPTLDHMARMALRQYRLIWRYRFFYQELNILLENDPELKFRFNQVRRQRMDKVYRFFKALAKAGVLQPDLTDEQLRDLIRISWIVSDFWLSFARVEQDTVDMATMQEGYQLILQLFKPVMTEAALRAIPDSLRMFSVASPEEPAKSP
ncbi:TetR/AcrR family transcriptional regulator [Kineobactrum salinum]|uniref:TetR/AcrR family transcriptional regulator n=1 Tax=Kineobactrum salinum TaxID=2708301 RepID=A0A6C0TY14_9GAMM|nr:TetR/AcrR family transcriptional regulator [Kineobactrum salinum]QIB64289.1 TetR/AcrR family transcriptional regulator [Kineobactrum salinum]